MENKYYKTDFEGIVKDPTSGAILNVDNQKLSAYKKQKQMFIDGMKNSERIQKVEQDLEEIKYMLGQLLKIS
jgi:hypothetical protein